MLAPAGAKLLDFGLARLDEATSPAGEPTVATEEQPLTREGTLVGTWPYLAPEQLRGGVADARSDVFALGAVLYEALTGERAFPGGTMAEVSAAILSPSAPDPRERARAVPASVAAVVRQCLAKDPAARWQSADDVALALGLASEAAWGEATPAPPAPRRPWLWPAIAGALGLAAVAALAALWGAGREPASESLRFVVPPPNGTILIRPAVSPVLAASPDGRRLAFVATAGGANSLWLWSAEDGESRRLEGTDGGNGPFFSPDGSEIAFFAADELRRIPVAGGPAAAITSAPSGLAGTWARDGTILFTRWIGPEAGLWRVSSAGGGASLVAPAASFTELRNYPAFLPDGRHYLFTRRAFGGPTGERQVCVASLDGGEPACLAPCDSQSAYASGKLACVVRGTLVARDFDPATRSLGSTAVPLAPGIRWFGPTGSAAFALSADGRVLAFEPPAEPSRLVWLDRRGRETGTLGEPGRYGQLELAQDGRRVGVEIWSQETGGRDLWSLDVASGVSTRLTFASVEANSIVWAPDGRRVAFGLADGGPPDVTLRDLVTGEVRRLLEAPGVQFPRDWSPDGRWILYEDYLAPRRDQRQVWLLGVLDGARRRFRAVPTNVYHPTFAPDGRRIAFVSEESGRPEVYVAPAEGNEPARRLSRSGGLAPRWRADGRELFYFQPDGMMVAVDPAAEAPPPTLLFHVDGVLVTDFDYDVAPDGQRFLVRLAAAPEGSQGLRVSLRTAGGVSGAR
jgi:Tol biopolymer transport system component